MSREREWWRRWPVDPTYRRLDNPPNSTSILDSVSLTKIVTDPSGPVHVETDLDGGTLLEVDKDGAHTESVAPDTAIDADFGPARAGARFRAWREAPRRPVAVSLGVLCLVALLVVVTLNFTGAPTHPVPLHTGKLASQITPQLTSQLAPSSSQLNLPAASSFPTPTPPSIADGSTAPYEVFAYAPYWSLPQSAGFPVSDVSTLAYFSVDINADGSIDKSGPGWDGYSSQDLVDLVSRAHEAGVRVVLTVTDFSQSSLDAITHDPNAGKVLGSNLLYLLKAKDLDGVNLDFEGTGSTDRAGLDDLVADVSSVLRAANPNYQITMATDGSSASDSDGFYDIKGLAPSVNAFFVMTYDMENRSVPSATAPLKGPGETDESVVSQYLAVVPGTKIILGAPLYGYDWPTTGPGLGAAATGAPTAVPYEDAASVGPTYWDPTSETAWTSYQSDGQWHQIFFDDPASLALKSQLVSNSNLLGIGVWALGMEGSDNSVLTAVDGGVAPVRLPPLGPAAGEATLPAASGTTTPTSPPSTAPTTTAPTTSAPSTTTTAPKATKCSKSKTSAKCSPATTTSTTSTTIPAPTSTSTTASSTTTSVATNSTTSTTAP
jgi:hypothetical protein